MGKKAKAKKNIVVTEKKVNAFSPAQIKKFIDEVKVEFSKIVWPDRKVTFGLTGIVIVLSIIASAYLGLVDLVLGKLVTSFLH